MDENHHADVISLLSDINREVHKYHNELSWETLDAFSEYEEHLTDSIKDELEDFEEELNENWSEEKKEKWFFWKLFWKVTWTLNLISSAKNIARAWAWVLSFLWYENYSNYIKQKWTNTYNKIRVFLSDTLWDKFPSLKFESNDSPPTVFENDYSLFRKSPEDVWLVPWSVLWSSESYNWLTQYYRIKSTKNGYNETWESRNPDCTCLDWLKADTVIWARNIARYMQSIVGMVSVPTITWWTEEWHAQWDVSHYNGDKLDFSVKDQRWKIFVSTFGLIWWIPKTITLYWQEITLLYHGKDPHIDAKFWKIPKEWEIWELFSA